MKLPLFSPRAAMGVRASLWSIAAFAALSLSLAACVHPVRRMYATEFSCPVEKTRLQPLGGGRFRVNGCDDEWIYQCGGNACFPDRRTHDESLARPQSSRASGMVSRSSQGEVKQGKNAAGDLVTGATIQLAHDTKIELRAAPSTHPGFTQLQIMRTRTKKSDWSECDLMMMVNGQRVEVAPGTYKHERADSLLGQSRSVITTKLPQRLLLEMGAAQQIAFRVCDERWSLDAESRQVVSQFAATVKEELAWQGDAQGSTGDLIAPSSGWLAWAPPSTRFLKSVDEEPLSGEKLFALLAPSVYKLEVTTSAGSQQGSAVAISKSELLTNCHVVEGGVRFTAKQAGREFAADLAHSDPKSDRCILRTSEELHAVRGVRPYADLRVGETAYTLGSPSGLDATLAEGIVSGLRSEDGKELVQTTAPISPGSSGGGLFDARGNLLGITQLVKVDAARVNQSLNFAIPADAFWKP